jgi:N-methylhydantoinase A
MYVSSHGEMVECPVYERPDGALDGPLRGPAIVEQYDTTTVVDEGWSAVAAAGGRLILERA